MSTTKTGTTNKATEKKKRVDVYQMVTDKIIALLEKGVNPWKQTWTGYGLAKNYATGNPYRGINLLLMTNTEHPIPYFMSFRQVKAKGGAIKKGAKAEQVVFFKKFYKDADGNSIAPDKVAAVKAAGTKVKSGAYIKYSNVFNIADIEGIDFDLTEIELTDNEQIDKCEQLIKTMPNPPAFESVNANKACYSPTLDSINMPTIQQFTCSEEYYCTLFHELTHSTGHESRLNREGITNIQLMGSSSYSVEELIAEMGAAFLCAKVGIDQTEVTENSAAYLAGWLKVLKKDKRFLFKAATQAQKAADYILGETRSAS